MGIYELKFKKRQLNVILGIVGIVCGLFWTSLLIASFTIFKAQISTGTVFFTVLIVLNIILDFLLGKHYITFSLQTYVKIYDKELEIHKGLLSRKQFIKYEDIEEVRLIGEKVVIIMMDYCSNKEIVIWSGLMYLKDLDILLDNLSKNNILVK
ncbi:hypothetical protein [Clostridium magnum]|uniref:Uncharacterized protein n=1 Tax=Clostridium magnum DSM 2767 TaxID=1121326 RepID=A0A161YJ27_9CLOT|nr:hypothetical protein [Clostridium magnum]KZL90412.1 hypothetical protein CLMAG_41830 [Clostridium magnum DSM 2767]SHH84504.1 hypothetical protein SAMN02745944_01560 [Clostridium magnum DSM 2767]